MVRGETYQGSPCGHCGETTKYRNRKCVNFYKEGHREMVYVPPVLSEKECRCCNVVKPIEDFEIRGDTGKRRTECRECRASGEAARRYGLTREDVDAMHENQGGRCAICGSDGSGHSTFTRLVIDHCHGSGKVRGLLCATCNSGLGHFKDSVVLLEAAKSYLLQNQ